MAVLQGYKIDNWFLKDPLDLGKIKIYQVGRYYPEVAIGKHVHSDFFELTVVTEGEAVVLTNEKKVPIKKNDIYVSFPFDRHAIMLKKDVPFHYDHIAFGINNPEYRELLTNITELYPDPDLRIISDQRINNLVVSIIGEFEQKQKYYQTAVTNSIYNIIIDIVRCFEEKKSPSFFGNASDAEIFCNRIMNYIDTNIYNMESLNCLAEVTNYNYNYISCLFKKTMNLNLRDYFIDKKLELADTLLKEGKLHVWQIAEKLHYSSGNVLTKAYKKKYGVSPTKVLPADKRK